jgi:hypothetical protein
MGKKSSRPTAMINHVEHPNVNQHDWRLHAATAVSKPALLQNGELLDVGTVIKVAGAVKVAKTGETLQLGAPSVTAMFLDLAARLGKQEATLHREVIAMATNGITVEDEPRVFDGIENRMASLVFALIALESFANEMIEEAYGIRGYRYAPTLKSGLTVSYDLEHVENRVTLEEKLGVIVPESLSVSSPKGRTVWNHFKRLKELRNRISHFKGRDRGNSRDKTLWRTPKRQIE